MISISRILSVSKIIESFTIGAIPLFAGARQKLPVNFDSAKFYSNSEE